MLVGEPMANDPESHWLRCLAHALKVIASMPATPFDAELMLDRVRHTQEERRFERERPTRVLRKDLAVFDEEFPGLLPMDLVVGPPIPSKFLNAPDPILPPAPGTTKRAIMAVTTGCPSEHDAERLGDVLDLIFAARQSPWWGGDFYFAKSEPFEKVYFCRSYQDYGVEDGGPALVEAHPGCWFLRFELTRRDLEKVREVLEARLSTPVQILSVVTI